MAKVWDIIKRAWWAIPAVVALVVGGLWARRRWRKRLGAARDKAAVVEAVNRADTLRATRAEVVRRLGENDAKAQLLDEQIQRQKRAVIEAHEHGKGLSDAEILEAFREMGF